MPDLPGPPPTQRPPRRTGHTDAARSRLLALATHLVRETNGRLLREYVALRRRVTRR